MTVLCFTSLGIHCNFTVNSLPLSGTPSVYAGFARKFVFTVKFADIFAVNSLFSA
jgi:hypothetical protein